MAGRADWRDVYILRLSLFDEIGNAIMEGMMRKESIRAGDDVNKHQKLLIALIPRSATRGWGQHSNHRAPLKTLPP